MKLKPRLRILITGGAGFIGINSSEYFIKKGYKVSILDNLSRRGSRVSLKWLSYAYPNKFKFTKLDISKQSDILDRAVATCDVVLHLAGQVAVTTSVTNPREDFTINALGTFNILEAVRKVKRSIRPLVIYSSTNKVYGGLEDLGVVEKATRYSFRNLKSGVNESRSIDFHSPYGCSKGAADQYVRDYARIYDMDTVVFRQSCIYGPHQFGMEDQGWVAWFIIASLTNKPITVYGNGKQVRDLLYVEDLCRAYEQAILKHSKIRGEIFNIGGGANNTMSLLEFMPKLEKIKGNPIKFGFSVARPGDQPIFVSDINKASKILDWVPRVGVDVGIKKLATWVKENKREF